MNGSHGFVSYSERAVAAAGAECHLQTKRTRRTRAMVVAVRSSRASRGEIVHETLSRGEVEEEGVYARRASARRALEHLLA